MHLLNVGCGAVRMAAPWTNLDNLRTQLAPGTPERTALDTESNYVEHDISKGPLPFPDNTFDGVLLSHVIEHFDCHEAVRLLKECKRALLPGGVVLVSVPNASYFREVRHEDTPENAVRLFGEEIFAGDGEPTFMDYALFYWQHKQVLTEDALWCLLDRARFHHCGNGVSAVFHFMEPALNRRKFSIEMIGWK